MVWNIKVLLGPPKPIIEKTATGVVIEGKLQPPGTYTVKKGTTITLWVAATNTGGSGRCRVFMRDEKSGKILVSGERDAGQGYRIVAYKRITVESDLELKAYAAYWDGSKWVVTDQYGC